jgi:hypothetical protein
MQNVGIPSGYSLYNAVGYLNFELCSLNFALY